MTLNSKCKVHVLMQHGDLIYCPKCNTEWHRPLCKCESKLISGKCFECGGYPN